jgi:hypothetical protein
MDKYFVPYQPSHDLIELGFDEPCFAKYYQQDGNTPFIQIGESEIEEAESAGDDVTFECDAPLYQQAFRWFREKYFLHSCISAMNNGIELLYAPLIDIIDKKHKAILDFDVYISYEEAELECLKKLIEIVKEK